MKLFCPREKCYYYSHNSTKYPRKCYYEPMCWRGWLDEFLTLPSLLWTLWTMRRDIGKIEKQSRRRRFGVRKRKD